jgi:hypothetical protein
MKLILLTLYSRGETANKLETVSCIENPLKELVHSRTTTTSTTTMKVNSMFGRTKTTEEIPKDKFSKKQLKGWRKAISEDADEELSNTVSDISASTDGDLGDYLGSLDERSEDYQRYEKSLRVKHSKACKAMSVR